MVDELMVDGVIYMMETCWGVFSKQATLSHETHLVANLAAIKLLQNLAEEYIFFIVKCNATITHVMMVVAMTKIPWKHPLPPPHNGW